MTQLIANDYFIPETSIIGNGHSLLSNYLSKVSKITLGHCSNVILQTLDIEFTDYDMSMNKIRYVNNTDKERRKYIFYE